MSQSLTHTHLHDKRVDIKEYQNKKFTSTSNYH